MPLHLVKPPLPLSYLVFLPVFAGPYPGVADELESKRRIERVLEEGVDLFLDLTEPGECEPYAHLLPARARHVRLPLQAGGVPTEVQMDEIVAAIDRYSAAEGWHLYVHDANGIGRVGTAIGCWIGSMPGIARDTIGFLDELRREVDGPQLRGKWRSSPSLPEQRAFVRRYAHIRGQAALQDVEGGSR
jgi:hypothetical protein